MVTMAALGGLVCGGLYVLGFLVILASGLYCVAALSRSGMFLSSPHQVGTEPRMLMLLLIKSKRSPSPIRHLVFRW